MFNQASAGAERGRCAALSTEQALQRALRQPTREPDAPVRLRWTQGAAVTGATTLVAVLGALVTVAIAGSPFVLYFAQQR